MEKLRFLCLVVLIFATCKPSQKTPQSPDFQDFMSKFSTFPIAPNDTITHWNWSWNWNFDEADNDPLKGNLLPENLFFKAVDTAQTDYKGWYTPLFAIGKIDLAPNYVGLLIRTQNDEIAWDQATLFLVYRLDNQQLIQDFVVADMVGYEGYIRQTYSIFTPQKGFKTFESEEILGGWEESEVKYKTLERRWNGKKFDLTAQ